MIFKIKHIEKNLAVKGHELDVKTQECEEYEKSVVENQSMLQHSSARITELEDMQGELQRQVPAFKLCYSLHAFYCFRFFKLIFTQTFFSFVYARQPLL